MDSEELFLLLPSKFCFFSFLIRYLCFQFFIRLSELHTKIFIFITEKQRKMANFQNSIFSLKLY